MLSSGFKGSISRLDKVKVGDETSFFFFLDEIRRTVFQTCPPNIMSAPTKVTPPVHISDVRLSPDTKALLAEEPKFASDFRFQELTKARVDQRHEREIT